jgi:hypothetical protein
MSNLKIDALLVDKYTDSPNPRVFKIVLEKKVFSELKYGVQPLIGGEVRWYTVKEINKFFKPAEKHFFDKDLEDLLNE